MSQHSTNQVWQLVPQFLAKYRNENTRSRYAIVITAYRDWTSHRQIDPLTIVPEQIDGYSAYLGDRLKPSSVNSVSSILKTFYKFLQVKGQISINHWATQISLVDYNIHHAKAVPESTIEELHTASRSWGLRATALFRLLNEVGVQRQFVVELAPKDLQRSDSGQYTLTIRGSRSRSVVREIATDLGALIEELIITNGPGCLWVFPGYGSKHMQTRQVNRIVNRLAPYLTPRRLRKSNLQRRVDHGERLQDVAATALITIQAAAKHESRPTEV